MREPTTSAEPSASTRSPWPRRALGGLLALCVLALAAFFGLKVRNQPPPLTGSVSIEVDAGSDRHPISTDVYGYNIAAGASGFSSVESEARPTLLRLGGNAYTTYNWLNNDYNAASDYSFYNAAMVSSTAPAAAILPTLTRDATLNENTIVTVPILGYVAADRTPSDVRQTPDYLTTRYDSSVATTTSPMPSTPQLIDGSVSQAQFVAYLKAQVPDAPVSFSLDNEPDLWSTTQQAIHPDPTTYAEVASKDLEYATMIKHEWPSADVIGPVNYGWNGLVSLNDAPDAAQDGTFLPWWLRQVKAADQRARSRLIDEVDLHWYPQITVDGHAMPSSDDPALDLPREQAPRSLWDPSYVEDSYITKSLDGQAIELIPRIRGEIEDNNPGMGIDISEWDFGGGGTISGAIATADTLGILGREGVHAAAYWPIGSSSFADAGFAAFRNFDGKGSGFDDTSVEATTSNIADTSVYASVSGDHPDRETLVLINKKTGSTSVALRTDGSVGFHAASRYELTGRSTSFAHLDDLSAVATNEFELTLPAQSITVLRLS